MGPSSPLWPRGWTCGEPRIHVRTYIYIYIYLVVEPTHWKTISQNGNLPQIYRGEHLKKNETTTYIYIYTDIPYTSKDLLRFGVLGIFFWVQIPNLRRCLDGCLGMYKYVYIYINGTNHKLMAWMTKSFPGQWTFFTGCLSQRSSEQIRWKCVHPEIVAIKSTFSSWWLQPCWKTLVISQIGSFPQVGMKIKPSSSWWVELPISIICSSHWIMKPQTSGWTFARKSLELPQPSMASTPHIRDGNPTFYRKILIMGI